MNENRLLERISCEPIDKNDPPSYDCVCKVPIGKDIRLIVRIDEAAAIEYGANGFVELATRAVREVIGRRAVIPHEIVVQGSTLGIRIVGIDGKHIEPLSIGTTRLEG